MYKCKSEGIECEEEYESINEEKLEVNISRAKSKIFELAYCNPWEYFFTGTLNAEKYNRQDLEKFHKDLTQFIRDQRSKYGTDIQFLFIPEKHKDGKSWHVHGFIMGVPLEALRQFKIGDKMSKKLAEKVRNGDIVYDWKDYHSKFGFCDLEKIKNPEAVSKYVTKYINKDIGQSVQELNAHLYYRSRGLQEAKQMKKGHLSTAIDITPSSDFIGQHCRIQWFEYTEENLQKLLNCIC